MWEYIYRERGLRAKNPRQDLICFQTVILAIFVRLNYVN